MKTYNKRFNAQRAARAELGDDAIEGIDFRTCKSEDGSWTWEQGRKPAPSGPKPEIEKAPAETKSAEPNSIGKRADIEAAARAGKLPEPPDFSAETHKRFRTKLAKLAALADAGDIEGLKAITINPVSSSPKAMARYRELCLMALEARK